MLIRSTEPWGAAARRRAHLSAAAGALLLLVLRQAPAGHPLPADLSLKGQWLASLGPVRPVEGRLVGFDFADFSAVTVAQPPGLEVRLLVRRIGQRASRQPVPSALADFALVKLVAGRPDAAVALLHQAIAKGPADAALLCDLAAATLAMAPGDPRRLVEALSATERALRLVPSLLAARFNRALLLEKLQLRRQSRAAWHDYLHRDPQSEWAVEARRRLMRLATVSRKVAFRAARDQLQTAALAGDETRVARIALDFPQESRIEAQDRLLPAWAQALRRGDEVAARRHLAMAAAIGSALRRAHGDGLVSDTLAVIDRSRREPRRLRSLQAGELAYAAALASYDGGDYQAARIEFARAQTRLRASASPVALWADFYLALCDYYAPDYRRAIDRLGAAAAGLPVSYSALRGRIFWIWGLIEIAQSNFAESLRDYSVSLAAFSALGEPEHEGAIHLLLAENLRLLGEPARAWQHRLAALALENRAGESPRLQAALQEAAAASLDEGEPELASRFQAEAIATALALRDSHLIAESYLRRLPIDVKRADYTLLDSDLAQVKHSLAAIPDLRLRHRLWADAISAASPALLRTRPRQAVRDLSTAIAFYRARGFSLPRANLLLDRAQGRVQLGEPELAEHDVSASLGEIEGRARRIRDPSLRLKVYAQALPILRQLTLLEWRLHRDPWATLAYAERAHRGVLPGGPRGQLSAMARRLPGHVALIELMALPDRLLTFCLTREGLSGNEQLVGAARFDEVLGRFAAARESHRLDAARASLADLYDLLVRPLPRSSRDKALLVFIPDDTLLGVPFGALLSRTSGRHLVQERTVMVAPSALALASLDRPGAGRRPPQRALAAGDPAFDRSLFPDLDALPASRTEARVIGALYPFSTVLIGRDATPRRVLASLAVCDVVHLGAHALDLADASLLLLAPSDHPSQPADAGTLSAGEILRADLRGVSLVVLASCGKTRRMAGGWSLSRSFIAAGAASVVESLWQVGDGETADLFVDFHRLVSGGVDPVEALRQSQLRLLGRGDLRGALDWAAFQVVSTLIPRSARGG
jgi:CHAT domain-containing protein